MDRKPYHVFDNLLADCWLYKLYRVNWVMRNVITTVYSCSVVFHPHNNDWLNPRGSRKLQDTGRPWNGTKWMFREYGQGPKSYDGIFLLAVTQALYYYISLGQITFDYIIHSCAFTYASLILLLHSWIMNDESMATLVIRIYYSCMLI